MIEENNLDLEGCPTVSSKQCTGCQPSSSSGASRHCTIAVQDSDGRAVLINTTIKEEGNGDLVFSSVKEQLSQALITSWHQQLIGKLLMGLVGGTARIKQVQHIFSNKKNSKPFHSHSHPKITHRRQRLHLPGHQGPPIPPPRVYLQDFTLDPLLTEALQDPHILFPPATYPLGVDKLRSSPSENDRVPGHRRPQYNTKGHCESGSTCVEQRSQDVIVIRRVIDRAKVAWLLFLLLLFSLALGLVVGVCSHDAKVGIAVSAGVFALASFVQGLVAWVHG